MLVVENRANWQKELDRLLRRLGDDVRVDIAATYGKAVEQVSNTPYDLAVVDLSLPDDPTDQLGTDARGMALVQELRQSRFNRGCGVIILTAYPTTERVKQALRDYAANDFLEKADFSGKQFLEVARKAIRDARLTRAENQAENRYRLTVTFSREHLVATQLTGPDRSMPYWAQNPASFAVSDLARRADTLNLLILDDGADAWRMEAQSIGEAIYTALASDRHVLGDLIAARALARRFSDLWLEFSGPPEGLGVPFELLRDEQDPLALSHIISRRIEPGGPAQMRKPEAFHKFLRNLVQANQPLRILLVAANIDDAISSVDEEVATLSTLLDRDLKELAIRPEIIALTDDQATYDRVADALQSKQFHLFHFAGHGRFDDRLPETSGLMVRAGTGSRILTAADLMLLCQDSDLRLAFLSGCVSARTADRVGRGDFYGTMEALVRADVPIVLGYRWTVADAPAMRLADAFYQALWRTLSPGEAALAARHSASMGTAGRDDDTWASLVLVDQSRSQA
jgi:CheY-like chemotaxis protein